METNLLFLMTVAVLVGVASGLLGSFMVIKRMSLVGDALSHVALPGMAIALLFGIDPILGALITLTISVIGIWYLGEKTEVYSETLVGVFFTAALAIGILITPQQELLEALFGNINKITLIDGLAVIISSIFIFALTIKLAKSLILGVISEDLTKSMGIDVSKVNLIYLLLVGLVVALGVKFVGTFLTGALVIVPAAAAKNISRSIKSFQATSSLIGAVSAAFGIAISRFLGIYSGASVILVGVVIFIVSYFFRSKAK